jgi:hypothetical protein
MSQIAIINSALIKISESPLSSNDGSRRAVYAFSQYDPLRKALLRSYRWNFAMKRVFLAPQITPPVFGFGKKCELPNDCLQLHGIFDTSEPDQNYTTGRFPYRVEGRNVLVNLEAPGIFYTADVTDTAQFDPLFSEALAWKLAVDLAYPLTTGPQGAQLAQQGLALALRDARFANAIEGTPEVVQTSEWVDAHYGARGRFTRIGPVLGA